jgi:hypothetical protein
MKIIDWWESHPRDSRNIIVVLTLDTLLLAAVVFGVPYLHLWWYALTNTTPNLFYAMLNQLLAAIYGLAPDSQAGGTGLLLTSQYFSLLTYHLFIAFLVGFVLRKKENTTGWRITNYCLLAFLLVVLHLIGTFFAYWAY